MARRKPPRPSASARKPIEFETLTRFAAKRALPLILLLMLGALALRASDLRADPPPDLSWSTGPYTDEALNTYSARNMMLYGRWRVDDFFPLVVYPFVNYMIVLVFKLLGMGFVQVKLLSLLAGVASVLVIFLLVREDAGHLAGLLAGLALATCFPLVMYSRLGLVESVQILFLLLTGLYYVRGLKRPWQMGLAGLLGASTILLVKVSAAFIAPALAAAVAWELLAARKDRAAVQVILRAIGWGLAGIGVALGIWLVIVFLPHRADYFQYVLRHSLESPAGHPQGLVAYLLNTFTIGIKSRLLPRLSWVALLGFLALPVLAAGRKPALRFLGLWFLLALLMLGYMNYRPDRYELVLLPALIAGFAVTLARVIETGTLLPPLRPTVLKNGLYTLWLWILITQLTFYTNGFWGALRPKNESGLLVATLVIAAAAGAVAYAAVRIARSGFTVRPLAVRAAIALALLLLAVRMDLVQYSRWFRERTHVMVESGADLDRALPEDAVLIGNWAPAILVGSKRHAVPMTDWANVNDPVGRFGATHLVSAENGFDFKLLSQIYPDMMPVASVIRQYEVRGIRLLVYELPERSE